MCEVCGGSGILNVGSSVDLETWVYEASYCHICPVGKVWKEVGLE